MKDNTIQVSINGNPHDVIIDLVKGVMYSREYPNVFIPYSNQDDMENRMIMMKQALTAEINFINFAC